MPQINAHLAVEPLCNGEVAFLITDAYGHINGRIDLNSEDVLDLTAALEAALDVQVVDVDAEEVTEESPQEFTDWDSLTKGQIVQKVYDDYGIELDEGSLKAQLVLAASEIEEAAQA